MKILGYKLTLLVFLITLLSGFYMRLPLLDNLIRSFVIYLVFSVLYMAMLLIINHITLESMKSSAAGKQPPDKDKLNHATPNMAK
ncbi:hypothetical protein B1H10_02600 [candidate division KSB1 bacterium 4484_188]|nr:MAG: hypothetical protein B1H10_02600 [candidate division KSB1 bacterium 4484_188]HFE63388.1 hypothetical protein [Caldithrix sp.]